MRLQECYEPIVKAIIVLRPSLNLPVKARRHHLWPFFLQRQVWKILMFGSILESEKLVGRHISPDLVDNIGGFIIEGLLRTVLSGLLLDLKHVYTICILVHF